MTGSVNCDIVSMGRGDFCRVNPNVADLYRGKTRQSASDVAAHSLGQVEAYFTVREVLAEASTVADGVLWREHSAFGRWRLAMLGLSV